jgi:hypothetical protein
MTASLSLMDIHQKVHHPLFAFLIATTSFFTLGSRVTHSGKSSSFGTMLFIIGIFSLWVFPHTNAVFNEMNLCMLLRASKTESSSSKVLNPSTLARQITSLFSRVESILEAPLAAF